jgi:hypothetical protein
MLAEGLQVVEWLNGILLVEEVSPKNSVIAIEALDRLNRLRTTALTYQLEKFDEGRIETAELWTEELEQVRQDLMVLEQSTESSQILSAVKKSLNGLEHYTRYVEKYHEASTDQWALQYKQREVAAFVIIQGEKLRTGVQKTNDEVAENDSSSALSEHNKSTSKRY